MNKSFIQNCKEVCLSNRKRRLVSCFAALLLVFSCYNWVVLPTLDTWGATQEEIVMPLPGDSLVPGKTIWQMTVATTINAPAEKIFPYFLQASQDKAGFYSFDWLERLFGFGIYNTYTIKPEWQTTKAGDFSTFHQAGMGMRVHEVIPNERLTMITNGLEQNHLLPKGKWEMFMNPLFPSEKGHYIAWNWDFNLFPQPDGSTRVVVRCKASAKGNPVSVFIFKHAFAFVSDVMDIEMLRRVKMLAEGTYPLD